MAGSIIWADYVGETGQTYAIRVDKTNANATCGGQTLMVSRSASSGPLTQGLKKRYVNTYNDSKPAMRRKFYIGNLAAINEVLKPGNTIAAEDYPGGDDTQGQTQTWVITSYRGEKTPVIPVPGVPDTGLVDS